MKLRYAWVSNSSSTSFILINKTNKAKHIIDFGKETVCLVDKFHKEFGDCFQKYKFTSISAAEKQYIKDSYTYDYIIPANGSIEIEFGDCQDNVMGTVCDYMLRKEGESNSFKWKFDHFNR